MSSLSKRYYLLDLLKFSCLLAIQTLHAWEFVFFSDDFYLFANSVVYEFMTNFARSFSIGGQILVAIIYFLFSFKEKSPLSLLKIAGFALIGQLVLALAFMDETGLLNSIEWDIYAYIAFTNVLIALIPVRFRSSFFIAIPSFILLLIPTNWWTDIFPSGVLYDIITGRKSLTNTGAWAILPWFFHALLFFCLGALSRKHIEKIHRWHKFETYLWGIPLISAIPFLGLYFHTPIGPNYYVFNFNQPPYVYWANFLPFLFWMRISFLNKIQNHLQDISFFQWISSLMWVRHVGLTYLLAIIYTGLGAEFDQEMKNIPYLFDIFYASIMPVCELCSRVLIHLKGKISERKTLRPL